MSGENVIGLDRPKSSLLEAIGRTARQEPPPVTHPSVAPAPPDDTLVSPEELAPLPQTGDAYEAHSRVAGRPLATVFFLSKSGLPDGFCYAGFERVRMIETDRAGAGPALLVRFNGSVVYEVLIEGRNLLTLCSQIGRQVIHWVREHPTGRDDGGPVFIRRITIREIERN